MRIEKRFGGLGLVSAVVLCATLKAQDPVLSEFMAVNRTTLADEDGDFSDWVEIYNPSAQEVSLKDWALTDDAKKLSKWKFPDIKMSAGGLLLVFASEKNRAVAGRELHTNFKLDPDGEYLALVKADGTTITSEIAPEYALQIADVSYGIPMESAQSTLLGAGATAHVQVPASDALGATWTQPVFDDAAWLAGPTGIGYDKKSVPTYTDLIQTNIETQMFKVNTSVYVRLPFQVADLATAAGALVLKMKFEDGFVAYLNGVEVARLGTPPALAWNAKAPVRRLEKDAQVFASFNISGSSALLKQGANVLAIHALNDSSTAATSDFLLLPEIEVLKVTSAQLGTRLYLEKASPGLPNGTAGSPDVAEEPEFSKASGTYADALSVELTSPTPGATVRYTIDRSLPTEASPAYAGPISVAVTTMIRARSFAPNSLPSPAVSSSYVLLNANVKDFSSNLPIMVVETFGKPLPEDPLTFSVVSIHDNPAGRTALVDAPVLITRAGLKKRGSSSLGFPKNHFAMELWDEDNGDKEAEILDMPKESDWILNGPYTDKTLMRDYLAYDWSNKMGRYAVRSRFVELFLNQGGTKVDSNDYWGVYVFMEKIKRGDDRVDIKRLHASETSEPEVAGGYILKNDRLDPGDVGLATKRGIRLAYVYPKEKEATTAQKAYLKGYLDEFETVLYGNGYTDPNNGYAKYIDVDSFIDQHILTELCKNIDGYRLSTFMYKDRDGKLVMGPAWDYNLSLGNANYLDGWKPEGWYYPLVGSAQEYPWYPRLFQDVNFLARYKQRWTDFRKTVLKTDLLLQQIDDIAGYLEESQLRNFVKWRILGTYVWPNQYIGQTYADEIGFMKSWLATRVAWMDSTFVVPPIFSKGSGDVEPGFKLEITSNDGPIYYTVNLSDPRNEQGLPSTDSVLYDPAKGVVINSNIRVRARVKAGEIWSGLKEGTYVTEPPPLVISEIMYNPPPPPAGSAFRALDFKYIEVLNTGSTPFNLSGVRFTKGVVFDFTSGALATLGPGEYAVVVRNKPAFESRYGVDGSIKVAGAWTQDLSDRGESVAIKGSIEETIVDFTFTDAWYPETDGQGKSLVLINPTANRATFASKEAWRVSGEVNGSPGREDKVPDGGLQRAGDISQDGQLNITDAINLLRFLFQGLLTELPCQGGGKDDPGNKALADVDGDGGVNLTDAVYTLRYLFQEGPPPSLGADCVRIVGCGDACTQ